MGGSSWLGAVGFVNAGLELAHQVASGDLELPHRIYIANGTMGSCAGLALGLALADLPTELHAVRVVDDRFTSPSGFERLMRKTAMMLHRITHLFLRISRTAPVSAGGARSWPAVMRSLTA